MSDRTKKNHGGYVNCKYVCITKKRFVYGQYLGNKEIKKGDIMHAWDVSRTKKEGGRRRGKRKATDTKKKKATPAVLIHNGKTNQARQKKNWKGKKKKWHNFRSIKQSINQSTT